MRLSVIVGIVVGGMLVPMAALAETHGRDIAGDSEVAQDVSLTPKEAGCQWRVPTKGLPPIKKGRHKRAPTLVSRVLFEGVPCKTIKMIAVRGDGMKAALTMASEGTPESVATGPGTIAMVYPLIYRMFEADLTNGKVAEFGLPRFEFPDDLRPAAAVGLQPPRYVGHRGDGARQKRGCQPSQTVFPEPTGMVGAHAGRVQNRPRARSQGAVRR